LVDEAVDVEEWAVDVVAEEACEEVVAVVVAAVSLQTKKVTGLVNYVTTQTLPGEQSAINAKQQEQNVKLREEVNKEEATSLNIQTLDMVEDMPKAAMEVVAKGVTAQAMVEDQGIVIINPLVATINLLVDMDKLVVITEVVQVDMDRDSREVMEPQMAKAKDGKLDTLLSSM